MTDFTAGVVEGIDKKMEVTPEIEESLRQSFEFTICKLSDLGSAQGETISVYTICKQSFDGRLVAKAYDGKSREIGRSLVDVKMIPGDARYVTFRFPSQMDSQMVKRFSLQRTEQKTPN